jgi:hypothetical protein
VVHTSGPWRREGDKLICQHGTYELPLTCPTCTQDPGELPDEVDEPLPSPPDGCLDTVAHERKLVALADYLEEKGKELCVDKGRINYATAARLFEVAIKARREASQQASVRERRAYVKAREKRIRDRMRGATH